MDAPGDLDEDSSGESVRGGDKSLSGFQRE